MQPGEEPAARRWEAGRAPLQAEERRRRCRRGARLQLAASVRTCLHCWMGGAGSGSLDCWLGVAFLSRGLQTAPSCNARLPQW